MARSYTVRGRIIAEDQATPAVERAQGAFSRFTSFLADRFVITLGDVTRAVRAVVDTFAGFVNAAAEEELAIKKLGTALSSLGPAAGAAVEALREQAAALQSTTTASDDAILAGQALVASFTDNISEIQAATVAALDLAAATGQDLHSAFLLLGKAAAGETGTLARYGIVVDDNIPRSERFAAAIAAVNEQFGGQAAARVETFTGALEQLGNAWGEVQEAIGRGVQANDDATLAMRNLKAATEAAAPGLEQLGKATIGRIVSAFSNLVSLAIATAGSFFQVRDAANETTPALDATAAAADNAAGAINRLSAAQEREARIQREFKQATKEAKEVFEELGVSLEQDVIAKTERYEAQLIRLEELERQGVITRQDLAVATAAVAAKMAELSPEAAATAQALTGLSATTTQAVPAIGQFSDGVERQKTSLAALEVQLARSTAAVVAFRAAQGQQVQQLTTEQLVDQGFTFSQGGTRINSPRAGGGSRLVRPGRTFEVRGGSFV